MTVVDVGYYTHFALKTGKPQLPRVALRGFKPGAVGVGSVLGELETAVMEALWTTPRQSVTEVEHVLQRRRPIAHTKTFQGDCVHVFADPPIRLTAGLIT